MKHHLDWSSYRDAGMGDAYADIPKQGGDFAKAIAVCINSRQCERDNTGVMCPSFKATGNPHLSTGGRVRLLKTALSQSSLGLAEQALLDPTLREAMETCVACKGCKRECEANVDMSLIKAEYLASVRKSQKPSLRGLLFAHTPRWLARFRWLRHLLGWTNRNRSLAWLANKLLGLATAQPLPVPNPRAFDLDCRRSETLGSERPDLSERTEVVLLVDTFTRHFEPEIGEAAIRVLEAAGYAVNFPSPAEPDARPLCCGRTYLAQGMIDDARTELKRLLEALLPHVQAGKVVVGLEASCVLGLRDDAKALGLGSLVEQIAPSVLMLEEFLSREATKDRLKLTLDALPTGQTLVHGHCHQKAAGAIKAMRRVLKLIPEHDFSVVQASCCGMAGTFGLETEHAEMSLRMAEEGLFPALRQAPDARIIANGFSCRQQILRHGVGRPVHLATLLAARLSQQAVE